MGPPFSFAPVSRLRPLAPSTNMVRSGVSCQDTRRRGRVRLLGAEQAWVLAGMKSRTLVDRDQPLLEIRAWGGGAKLLEPLGELVHAETMPGVLLDLVDEREPAWVLVGK